MSNKVNIFISILLIVMGGAFIWFFDRETLPGLIVVLCGLTFVVPAVLSLLSTFFARKENRMGAAMRIIQMVCGVGGLVFGLCIILMPDVFRPLLFYPFGALMAFGGLFQLYQLSNRNRPVPYPGWLFAAPVLVLTAGIVTLCLPALHDPAAERWLLLIAGISALIFGVNGIIISVVTYKHIRSEALKANETMQTAETAEQTVDNSYTGMQPTENEQPE